MTFPPIYCITLREEPWKQRWAENHFYELGFSADTTFFVPGVQGVTIGLKATNPYEFKDDGTGVFLHPASLGCIVSHRMALGAAYASGAEEFIICEDDVEFDKDIVAKWPAWKAALPSDANVVQLEHCTSEDKAKVSHGPVSTCYPYPFCSACIWWTREAAALALSLMRPLDRPYDILLIERVYPFLKHYIAEPTLARQKSNHYGEAVGTIAWPSSIGTAVRDH